MINRYGQHLVLSSVKQLIMNSLLSLAVYIFSCCLEKLYACIHKQGQQQVRMPYKKMIPVFNNTAYCQFLMLSYFLNLSVNIYILIHNWYYCCSVYPKLILFSNSCYMTQRVRTRNPCAHFIWLYFCTFTHSNEIWFCVCAIQNTSQQRKFLWIQTAWVFFRAQLLNHVFSMRLTGNDKHFFSTVVAMTQKFHIYAYWVFIQIETNAMLLPYRTLRLELFILSNWFIKKIYERHWNLHFCFQTPILCVWDWNSNQITHLAHFINGTTHLFNHTPPRRLTIYFAIAAWKQ